jgi:catechol 2,3-dioxygenase-like lactoylglutathione lyase family enzyme
MSFAQPLRQRIDHSKKGVKVPQIKHVGRVMVPVADQDTAIAFYTEKLGFSLTADVPFGEGERWVEVGLPAGGATLALVPVNENYPAGGMTGIALDSTDPKADHAELTAAGVDVDAEIMGGDGVVPLLFFIRDQDANHLMIVETPAG